MSGTTELGIRPARACEAADWQRVDQAIDTAYFKRDGGALTRLAETLRRSASAWDCLLQRTHVAFPGAHARHQCWALC